MLAYYPILEQYKKEGKTPIDYFLALQKQWNLIWAKNDPMEQRWIYEQDIMGASEDLQWQILSRYTEMIYGRRNKLGNLPPCFRWRYWLQMAVKEAGRNPQEEIKEWGK